jgi:hypothetical protein
VAPSIILTFPSITRPSPPSRCTAWGRSFTTLLLLGPHVSCSICVWNSLKGTRLELGMAYFSGAIHTCVSCIRASNRERAAQDILPR